MSGRGGRVVVVGSANVDRTIDVPAVPASGETVLGGEAVRGPGGKGLNQAVAASRAGASVAFVGTVGDDPDGAYLSAHLGSEGVDTSEVAVVARPTGLAVILLEGDGSNRIVVAPGANGEVDPGLLDLQSDDVVVCQLEIPTSAVAAALTQGREVGATTILNAAPATAGAHELLDLVDVLVVNEPELSALTEGRLDRTPWTRADLVAAARELRGPGAVVVTIGAAGAIVVGEGDDRLCPAPEVTVVDTTGAGDCFVGVVAASTAEGVDLAEATARAVEAASISVTRAGAASSMPFRDELGSAGSAT
ncbi:MAG: ribokinase [Actinomycetota bacterium]